LLLPESLQDWHILNSKLEIPKFRLHYHSVSGWLKPFHLIEQRKISLEEAIELARAEKPDFFSNAYIGLTNGITALFEPLGFDTSDWSNDFKTGGRLAFSERFGTPSNPHESFKEAHKVKAPELYKMDCNTLKAKSDEALA